MNNNTDNKRKTNFFRILKIFNKRKGFNASVRKAIITAMSEENNILTIKDQRMSAFLTYVLFRSYLKFYRWFVRDIYFRKGHMKFIIYSLDLFFPPESKLVYDDIKKELLEIDEHGT